MSAHGYAWLTDGNGQALRVRGHPADTEYVKFHLDRFDLNENSRETSVETATLGEAIAACTALNRGDPRWQNRSWKPLRPVFRRGLHTSLHFGLLSLAHVVGLIGPAYIGLLCFFELLEIKSFWLFLLTAVICVIVLPLIGLQVVRRLMEWVPARCPCCGGGAFWHRTMNIVYMCHNCPHVHGTGWSIRGGSEDLGGP